MAVLYGRRRCGKSRLLQETLPPARTIYYVADDREAVMQRAALAAEIGRLVPGFGHVVYPEWDAELDRLWREARPRTILVLDEFPALATAAPELPSLLQKRLDARSAAGIHVVIAGSSQRMMHGLVLDRSAPLFGRAREILKIEPLPAGFIREALRLGDAASAVESYAVWGGVPRYWELAADYPSLDEALRSLVLSPRGVLHDEPRSLLRDDLRDPTQAASVLALVGRGCHRLSEIAARLEKPATSLGRPLQRLLNLGLVRRDLPFGTTLKDSKRTLYVIEDPFLRFWFRFVDPERSRLETRQMDAVAAEIARGLPSHVASVWEDLARRSVPRLRVEGHSWRPASRWWGAGLDRSPMELDIVAESEDRRALLFGEAVWSATADVEALAAELLRKARNFPFADRRHVVFAVWVKSPARVSKRIAVFGPDVILAALRA